MDSIRFGAENRFLADVISFSALRTALDIGLIDALSDSTPMQPDKLAGVLGKDETGMGLLFGILFDGGVLERSADGFSLSVEFTRVLADRRSQLEQKITFIAGALHDIQEHFPDLLFDLSAFRRKSRTFQFFRYDLALDITPDAIRQTRKWVSYVTALTELEAPYLAAMPELSHCRRLLEIGGNSGAFAEAILEQNPDMSAVVMDLPAVCEIGRERLRTRDIADRLHFLPGDARKVSWPVSVDAVLFKSVLHDWPEEDVSKFLRKARDALAPGGKIVICERGPIEFGDRPMPLWMAANLVFAPFYRPADAYLSILGDLGMICDAQRSVNLDMPFNVVAATAA